MRGGMSNLLERGMAQAPSAPATSNLAPSRNGEHSEHVQCTDDALQSGIRIPAGPGESDPTYGVSEHANQVRDTTPGMCGTCASTWRITPRVTSAYGSWPPGVAVLPLANCRRSWG